MSRAFVLRVLVKALLLFLLCNLAYAALDPLPWLSRVSVYNTALIPGRARLPYSENPSADYNVTLLQLEGMLATHELSAQPKAEDEYRVFLLGDSAVWGWLLDADQTLSACLNRLQLRTSDGRRIRVYNLGYPILNATKDLLILDAAQQYDPDLVVWMLTLVTLFPGDQLYHGIVRAHPAAVRALITAYNLPLDAADLPPPASFWEQTLVGQRESLAAWLRLQLYGLAWAATGVDHRNPKFFTPVQQNLYGGELLFDGRARTLYDAPHSWGEGDLALEVVGAGVALAQQAGAETLLVNEPIFRSSGAESDLRYNFYYPRWAYDAYRDYLAAYAAAQGWQYVDLWDAAPSEAFTDSSLHLTPAATCEFAALLGSEIQRHAP